MNATLNAPRGKDAELQPVTTEETPLFSPGELRRAYPVTENGARTVQSGRRAISDVLRHEDERLCVIVGPCSIHDTSEAWEYACRLRELQNRLGSRLLLVMRVYGEKPRTTVGWRGLVNDPYLDGSFDMAEGLRQTRSLLVRIAELGLPVATEVLDIAVPPYLADLISFAAIGARTTESQPHRALASGLPCPVGFKNGTDGGTQIALDALLSTRASHGYVSLDEAGRCCTVRTPGNHNATLILRGGKATGPNYGPGHVQAAEAELNRFGLSPSLFVDASHANSGYDPARQAVVCECIARQKRAGSRAVVGILLESNLAGGKQSLPPVSATNTPPLRPGVSVTDACLGWQDTEALLTELVDSLE